ncbi:MAG: hypothetical protein IIB60_01705 [Planctomycetes bacterium]|nr:hypothetical protein [Planctomycetota bacterium]
MDRRTRVLALVFGVIIACGAFARMVYPRWIEPLVTIRDTIAEREVVLAELEKQQTQVDWAKREYVAFVSRVGSFDMRSVENDVRARLNAMIERIGFEEASTTPNRATVDKKTKIKRMLITVTATGTLESAITFLRDVVELPHVIRVVNPAIYPASRSKKKKHGQPGRVNLRAPIQLMVIPPQRLVGRLNPEDLVQPEEYVRHEGRDYSRIWLRTPLTEYIVLPPLVVTIKKPVLTFKQDKKRASLDVTVTGGDAEYTYLWEPSSGLDKPDTRRPNVDTSEVGELSYTVTVTDGQGETGSADVEVTITQKKGKRVVEKEPEPEPEPMGPKRWKDRRYIQFVMTLGRDRSDREMMVYNSKSRKTDYYTVGDEFDGGELVFVHQRGALARRQGGYYVYPLGARLNGDIKADEAGDYPRLQEVARVLAAATPPESDPEPHKAGDADADDTGDPKRTGGAPGKESDASPPDAKVGTEKEDPGERNSAKNAKPDAVSGKSQPESPSDDKDAAQPGAAKTAVGDKAKRAKSGKAHGAKARPSSSKKSSPKRKAGRKKSSGRRRSPGRRSGRNTTKQSKD